MIKADLITGFLGSGKTTFLKLYAQKLIDRGLKVGILENDYGAVNVDMLLLSPLEGERCVIETVSGACDADCHKRRFKTKLIAMGMSGYDRVLIEPSGIFDVDEFFDVLREEPLDRWFETGSVIAVVDSRLEADLSAGSRYVLASQAARAGKIVLSKTQLEGADAEKALGIINSALEETGCRRKIDAGDVLAKDWDRLDDADFDCLMNCGSAGYDYVKLYTDCSEAYKTLYFLEKNLGADELRSIAERLLGGEFGQVFRVKGFSRGDGGWLELNASKNEISLNAADAGQDVVIVIGEGMDESGIKKLFGE